MAKVQWSDPCLVRGPHVALVMSQKEYAKALKDADLADPENLADPFCADGCRAVTTTFRKGGILTAIVGLDPAVLDLVDQVEVASLLCHEAVHVWQKFVDNTCLTPNHRESWGLEAEAYGIQNISFGLMTSYAARYAQHTQESKP